MYKKYLVITSLVLITLLIYIYIGKSHAYIDTYSKCLTESSDSIKETINSYIIAFNAGNSDEILSFFCEETLDILNIDTMDVKNDFKNVFNSQWKIDEYFIKDIKSINNTIIVATVEYVMNHNSYIEDWVFKNVDSHWKLNNGVIDILDINNSIRWNDVNFTTNNIIHSIDGSTILTISFTNNNVNPLVIGLRNKAHLIITTTDTTYYTEVISSSNYDTNTTHTITSSFSTISGDVIKIELQGVYFLDDNVEPTPSTNETIVLYEI